jgi:hypothetical protein
MALSRRDEINRIIERGTRRQHRLAVIANAVVPGFGLVARGWAWLGLPMLAMLALAAAALAPTAPPRVALQILGLGYFDGWALLAALALVLAYLVGWTTTWLLRRSL